MARKKSPTLTDSELRLMRILWDLKSATVSDVVDALPADEPLAYSTVLTTLRILEDKGYVDHEKSGRAFVYQPIIEPGDARKDALHYVLDRFFNNSPELLLANVMEDENLSMDDLKEIHTLLAERKRKADSSTDEPDQKS